jgi:hypothetical protein
MKRRPKEVPRYLATAEGNTAAVEVVRGELNRDRIALDNFDEKFSHLTRDMGEDEMVIFKLDSKKGVRQDFNNDPRHFN